MMTPAEFKEARSELGFTQSGMARLLGIGMRTLQAWEGGEGRIPYTAEALILLCLNVPEARRYVDYSVPVHKREFRDNSVADMKN